MLRTGKEGIETRLRLGLDVNNNTMATGASAPGRRFPLAGNLYNRPDERGSTAQDPSGLSAKATAKQGRSGSGHRARALWPTRRTGAPLRMQR